VWRRQLTKIDSFRLVCADWIWSSNLHVLLRNQAGTKQEWLPPMSCSSRLTDILSWTSDYSRNSAITQTYLSGDSTKMWQCIATLLWDYSAEGKTGLAYKKARYLTSRCTQVLGQNNWFTGGNQQCELADTNSSTVYVEKIASKPDE